MRGEGFEVAREASDQLAAIIREITVAVVPLTQKMISHGVARGLGQDPSAALRENLRLQQLQGAAEFLGESLRRVQERIDELEAGD